MTDQRIAAIEALQRLSDAVLDNTDESAHDAVMEDHGLVRAAIDAIAVSPVTPEADNANCANCGESGHTAAHCYDEYESKHPAIRVPANDRTLEEVVRDLTGHEGSFTWDRIAVPAPEADNGTVGADEVAAYRNGLIVAAGIANGTTTENLLIGDDDQAANARVRTIVDRIMSAHAAALSVPVSAETEKES